MNWDQKRTQTDDIGDTISYIYKPEKKTKCRLFNQKWKKGNKVSYVSSDFCEYGELRDEMTRDRIVGGISNLALPEKMQHDGKLTLVKASELARESEAVRKQQSQMRDTGKTRDSRAVYGVRKQPSKGPYNNSSKKSGQPKVKPQLMGSHKTHPKVYTRCEKDHPSGKDTCHARMVKCHKCEV
uniref:Uncharacterized protein n=1 Tax=Amphimedon queenslandica TaxID=400682 RepID=A0A1X7VA73_AMPQE